MSSDDVKAAPPSRLRPAAILAPLVTVGAVTVATLPAASGLAADAIPMLYLAAVVLAALAGGLTAALLAAALSFLAYDFFFVEPRWTLAVAQPNAVLALTVFIGLALATGTLTARLADHAAAAERQSRMTAALLQFTRRIALTSGRSAVIEALVQQVGRMFAADVTFLSPADGGSFVIASSSPRRGPLTAREQEAARLAIAGAGQGGDAIVYIPVVGGGRTLGLLVVTSRQRRIGPEENGILAGLADQAGVALDRSARAEDSAAAETIREKEKLQGALLSSLSHDLRTPLAGITGAVTSLRELGDRMEPATRDDLLAVIEEETATLNRFLGNLFDSTRIESGTVTARREPVSLAEIAARAIARVKKIDPAFAPELSLATDLAPVIADPILLEQVLFNLLDNARKYGAGDEPPTLYARRDGDDIAISVTDSGPGISEGDLTRIFDKFYRRPVDRRGTGTGTGLGLAIVKGFVTAMGGRVTAESPAARKRGTRFTVSLPAGEGA